MSHYKPYPVYKESGVEWLGRVPEHWDIRSVKTLARLDGGAGFPDDEQGQSDNPIPFFKVAELASGLRDTANTVTEETAKRLGAKIFPPSTLVFAKVGAALLLNRRCLLEKPACLDNNMMALLPGTYESQWLFWVFCTLDMGLIANPGAVPSINQEQVGNIRLGVPTIAEQKSIAQSLRRETARIDALIEKKTRFIELLREKRQALITHAVTKGLDPNAKMKNSGVEWLGEVPEHWVCKKLMYWIDGYGSGTTPSKEDDYCMEEGLPWVTTGELREGLICETDKRVTDAALSEYSALKAHPVGSLVIAMYGATVGRLGLLGVPAALNQACFAIHPCKTISIRMLRWWFEGFRAELIELATGAGQPNISGDKIRNLFIAAPLSLAEQEQIADQIESRTLRIDGLVSKTERSIELLKERRSALITAAVTGQIDLREAV